MIVTALLATAALAKTTIVHQFNGAMPTGVTVSKAGRIFVTFPRWGDRVTHTLAEIRNGKVVAYPNATWNRLPSKALGQERFFSVQSAVVDPKDRLWAVDTGSFNLQQTMPGAPKLVCFNLRTNRPERTYRFPESVVHPTTYMNDIRFDLTRGKAGYAFITDSSTMGPNGIIVVDLASGNAWRKLNDHPSTKPEPGYVPVVEGQKLAMRKKFGAPVPVKVGSDGIAIDVKADKLYYCPMVSRHLYSVSVKALEDRSMSDDEVAQTVKDLGIKGPSDGLICDARGILYTTDYVSHQVKRMVVPGEFTPVLQLRSIDWPDTLSIGPDGALYVTANQLQRQPGYNAGKDMRKKPYRLLKANFGAKPQ